MIICHSKRFVFIHIQKAGGTSIELALNPFLSWSDLILGSSNFGEKIDSYYRARFGLSKHSSIADIERVCGEEILCDYYVFATVRDPLDRLCSLYNYVGSKVYDWAERERIPLGEAAAHITKEAEERAPALKWAASRAFVEAQTFSRFIRHEKLSAAAAFRSQTERLRSQKDGTIRAQFFRLEDREAWHSQLQKILGLEFTIPHANRTRLQLMRRDEISTEDRRYVEARFSDDYAAFGYALQTAKRASRRRPVGFEPTGEAQRGAVLPTASHPLGGSVG
jgi:hypothetical protein